MKTILTKLLILAALGGSTLCLGANNPPQDPFRGQLFPPDVILQKQQQLGLTEWQRDFIHTEIEKVHQSFSVVQDKLEKATRELNDLLKQHPADEKKALEKLEAVFAQEHELKRMQIGLLLRIRNQLDEPQLAKLRAAPQPQADAAKGKPLTQSTDLEKRLSGKMANLKEKLEKWHQEGRDPSHIGQIMQEFAPLLKSGKHKEAEDLLDRALKMADEKE